jgi:hypothetical protein
MADIARVMEWMVGDDTGVSSKSIAAFMCGADLSFAYWNSPPSDASDLGRCLRLLERFPEWKARMPEMASIDERWAKIIPHWDEAAAMLAEEVGIDGSKGSCARKTYAFMKSVGF